MNGIGKGNKNRGQTSGAKLRHSAGPSAAQGHVGPSVSPSHVVNKGRYTIGRVTRSHVGRAHSALVGNTGLVANLHPGTTKFGQIIQHKCVERMCALRATHDKQTAALPLAAELAHCGYCGPHRVAGKHAFFHVKAAGVGQRNTNAPCNAGQKAVAGPGNGVLLVQHAGHPHQTGRQHRRKSCVTAKASHNIGLETANNTNCFGNSQSHLRPSAHSLKASAQQTAHGQTLKGNTRLTHQPFFRPIQRAHKQQIGIGIATPQFLCHSQCRKDMPASAAGCQEDVVHVSAVREKFISRPTHSMVAKRLLPP